MNYNDEYYEDELDRMRARKARRQQAGKTGSGRKSVPGDSLEVMDFGGKNRQPSRRSEQPNYHRSERTPHLQNERTAHYRHKRRKRKPVLKLILLAAVLLIGVLAYNRFRDNGYWTIAVFGVDSRDGNLGKGALSDVEIICNIDKKTGEIRLVSVFRDSYLKIDSDGNYDKINEAYFLGGHEQAVNALRENLDLQIDDYATFNWKAVVDAINVLGGVDIEITDKEFAYINSFITETVNSTGVGSYQLEHSGMNHLDGVQAVAYARLRLMDTDFNRTERQRKVIGLAMEKAKKADAGTLKILVGAVFPQISTSIGVDDLISQAKNVRKFYIGQTSGFPFSHEELKISKKACVVPATLESNVIQLHSFLYDDTAYTPSETVKKISSHIAEVTGIGSPGKDTETGKNVGAEGNTGSGQSSSSKPQEAPAPAQTEPAAELPEEETSTGESVEEETVESTESGESPDSLADEPDETVKPAEAPSQSEQHVSEAPSSGNSGNGSGTSSGNGSGNGPVSRPGGSSNTTDGSSKPQPGPGTSGAPGGDTSGSGAVLEGPGHGSENSPETAGPGM